MAAFLATVLLITSLFLYYHSMEVVFGRIEKHQWWPRRAYGFGTLLAWTGISFLVAHLLIAWDRYSRAQQSVDMLRKVMLADSSDDEYYDFQDG